MFECLWTREESRNLVFYLSELCRVVFKLVEL